MSERHPEPTPVVEVFTAMKVTFRRGDGVDEMVRMVEAYYREDGTFMFELDPAIAGVLLRATPHRED